jgi:pimeloyl-ACP methyl ester carboxylesterase
MELTGEYVDTARIRTHCWTGGPRDGTPLLLVHGNLASGGWWRYVAEHLPDGFRVVAPDLRGFGHSEPAGVDATRGVRDFSDDLRALLEALGWAGTGRVHAAGWSLGGAVLQQYAIDHAADLASLILVDSVSPYGFGGTKDLDGTQCYDDFAGSGGGGASAEFVRRVAERDGSEEQPATSVRVIMRNFFGPRDNVDAVDENFLVLETLHTVVGDDNYPGDSVPSPNWPGTAPGSRGVLNAISPKYLDTSGLAQMSPQVPVVWIYGVESQVCSDQSFFDFGYLGKIGAVPGWPGDDVIPPQPQLGQLRAVLERYRAEGGVVREERWEGLAHGLPVEAPERLAALLAETASGTTT